MQTKLNRCANTVYDICHKDNFLVPGFNTVLIARCVALFRFRFLPSSIPVNDCLINSVKKSQTREANTLLTIHLKLCRQNFLQQPGYMNTEYAFPVCITRVNDEGHS